MNQENYKIASLKYGFTFSSLIFCFLVPAQQIGDDIILISHSHLVYFGVTVICI